MQIGSTRGGLIAQPIERRAARPDQVRPDHGHGQAQHWRRLPLHHGQTLTDVVRRAAADYAMPQGAVDAVVAAIDRNTSAGADGSPFAMIMPQAHRVVTDWLFSYANCPSIGVRLLIICFTCLNRQTNEVMMSRSELADALGTTAQEISRVMTLLEWTRTIQRKRRGKEVRYYMSHLVASHLPAAARARAQAEAQALRLTPPPASTPKCQAGGRGRGRVRAAEAEVIPPAA